MIPGLPQEDTEALLPPTCYFTDGKCKVDYVLVVPKMKERLRGDNSEKIINQFISEIRGKGLLVEKEEGKYHTSLIFLKIHGPHKVLIRYAEVFNIQLTCQNSYYKYKEKSFLKCLATPLTKPTPESTSYKRAEKTLSGQRPTDFTTAERSKIVFEILNRINFTFAEEECTMGSLLDRDIFLEGYSIHDGDCDWTIEGPLTDCQLLFELWPSFKYLFHAQPVHLLEKYFGPNIGFYFALVNLYNHMLLFPTVIGILTVFAGLVQLGKQHHYIVNEVCRSTIVLCSDQHLKTACDQIKLSYIIDNPVTIFYVVSSSFWGVVFWNLWQRKQAMLRLRWNLMSVKADRTMRREFQKNAKTRKSSITGDIEYYIPRVRLMLSAIFQYTVILLLIIVFFLVTFLVVQYRFLLRRLMNYDATHNANEIEVFTSSLFTSVIIMLINGCVPMMLTFYAKIIRFLTLLRMPRTQLQYNRMYLHMMFIISFANNFSPLFYLAFIKGFFHTYPGDVSDIVIIQILQSDLCQPGGCIVDLGMQLLTLMLLKTLVKWSLRFVRFVGSPWTKSILCQLSNKECGQWERDFLKTDLDDSSVNQLYTELVLQYSFITFFNASLPIMGLIAMAYNVIKNQHDAYTLLKLYRRPIIKKTPDIEGWNEVLKAVTIFGCISNTFIVAFRTDFIQRVLYQREHGTVRGYINSTLSKFAIKDFQIKDIIIDHEKESICYYRGFRYPPDHEKKYEPTMQFWQHLAVRAIYFIILEKIAFLLSMILGYLIPEIPRKVKVKLEHDERLLKSIKETQLEQNKKANV